MRTIVCLVSTLLAAAVLAGTARADAAYHTERLDLIGVAAAPGSGMVVNVHTNGPQVYAQETYALQHAVPGIYVVFLNVFPASLDCTGVGSFSVATAELVTNVAGNGLAGFTFTPELVDAFRGLTLSISWTLAGPATYATRCTVVVLD